MIDVSQLPKTMQWTTGADTGIRDEDIRGIWMSDIASRERLFGGSTDHAGINEYVIKYADVDHAKEQYASLAQFVAFRDSYPGNPPIGPTYVYKDLAQAANLNLRADQFRIACLDIYEVKTPSKIIETDCSGLFRYNNYLILIYASPVDNYSTIFSTDDLLTIFKAVDDHKNSYQ